MEHWGLQCFYCVQTCLLLQKYNDFIMENKAFQYFPTLIPQYGSIKSVHLCIVLEHLILKAAIWVAGLSFIKSSSVDLYLGLRPTSDNFPNGPEAHFCHLHFIAVRNSALSPDSYKIKILINYEKC